LDGDAQAYTALLTGCQYWLKRFFDRRMTGAQADDLVQETMISLHSKRSSYDPTRPFLPWLAVIARYRWIDALRKTARANETELHDDTGIDSDEDVVSAQLGVMRLLDALKPTQASVIRMVKLEGLTIREAAEKSGQTEALVKVNIHRGIKRMAALVESE
ncbi:MAG: sigma-70 family RNA polymerase sigma factor, partial [Alphaproteobacteria bacterium]|nr:sigma-70 family RNA polymerase sigma factor [Alphaproteobacteria bacterium]